MRDDHSRLTDILDAAHQIRTFVQGKTRESIKKDRLLQSAVLYQLYVIGEAARTISADLRTRSSHVPWNVIIGFRNHVAHEYFSLDLDIVWQTVTVDVPQLEKQIAQIVRLEFP